MRPYDIKVWYRSLFFNRKRLARLDAEVLSILGLEDSPAYQTTGVGGGDSAFLHYWIKKKRPRRVIEFGTGKSTWVIARAMERYCESPLRFVSMEEIPKWYE